MDHKTNVGEVDDRVQGVPYKMTMKSDAFHVRIGLSFETFDIPNCHSVCGPDGRMPTESFVF